MHIPLSIPHTLPPSHIIPGIPIPTIYISVHFLKHLQSSTLLSKVARWKQRNSFEGAWIKVWNQKNILQGTSYHVKHMLPMWLPGLLDLPKYGGEGNATCDCKLACDQHRHGLSFVLFFDFTFFHQTTNKASLLNCTRK